MDKLIDYRRFRFSKLKGEFRYVLLLLYWPFYGLAFLFAERIYKPPAYHEMYCFLDDYIPFNELFLIPYMFWFVFLVGMLAYSFFFDAESFTKMMQFIIITYTVSLIIFFLYPNAQYLRPAEFERANFLTRFMADFYQFDTNTNVCPSLHVIGSFAAMFCGWHTKRFSSKGWRIAFTVTAILISISTVFLKQHSVIDIIVAVPICIIAYFICYRRKPHARATAGALMSAAKGEKANEKVSV